MIRGQLNEGRPRASLSAGCVALLRERHAPPECAELREIFPQGVPVLAPLPQPVELEGPGREDVFHLDLPRCTDAQLEAVAGYVVKVCGHGTPAEVIVSLLVLGVPMPLRASLVASVKIPWRLLV